MPMCVDLGSISGPLEHNTYKALAGKGSAAIELARSTT